MNELSDLLNVKPSTQEYRLYYEVETGKALFYSNGDFPAGENYVVVDKAMYDSCAIINIKVVNKQVTKVDLTPRFKLQLIKSTTGWRTAKGHSGILDPNNELTEVQYFEQIKHD